MWLFGGRSSPEVSDEAEALKEEAEDLRLKLEALRMAEYREAQRAACGRGQVDASIDHDDESSVDRGAVPSDSIAVVAASGALQLPIEHPSQEIANEDLEAMYDFGRFVNVENEARGCRENVQHVQQNDQQSDQVVSMNADGAESEDDDEGDSESFDLERLRLVEAKLRQQQETLEAHAAQQERKLTIASKALEKTRAQLKQLTGQLEMKENDGSKSNTQADALQRLLVEKDRRLQAAAQDAANAVNALEEEPTRQPQPAPTAKENHEEQLLQLAAMTEELTDALETARDGEEDARRQMDAANLRIKEENDQRSACERELAVVRLQQASEVAALRKRLQDQEKSLAAERARLKQLEARPKFWKYLWTDDDDEDEDEEDDRDLDVIKKMPLESSGAKV